MGQTDGTSEPEEAVLAGKEALVVRTQEDSLLLFLSCAAGLHGLGTDFYPFLHQMYLKHGYSSPSTDSIIIVIRNDVKLIKMREIPIPGLCAAPRRLHVHRH